jgi:MoaA/NifB/PqqE/SkfB family radical SAM enzyme
MDYSRLYDFAMQAYTKIPYHFGGGRTFRPLGLFLEVTYRCNFRCSMCQFLNVMDDPRLTEKLGEELTIDEMKSAIDQVSRFGVVFFTGGEPLLRKDIMEAVRYACKGRKTYLVTNGILLKRDLSEEFVELGCRNIFDTGMASVGISLEGPESVHDETVRAPGSFGKILDNVRLFVEHKKKSGKRYPLIALKCVITAENIPFLSDMYRLAEETGVDIFNPITEYKMPDADRLEMDPEADFNRSPDPITGIDIALLRSELARVVERSKTSPAQLRLTPPGIGYEEVVSHYEGKLDLSNKLCYTPWGTAVISAYGDVFPCSNFVVGNIREEPLLKTWNNEKMRRFRREVKKRGVFPACAGCCNILTA